MPDGRPHPSAKEQQTMTIPFGRRRLVLTMQVVADPPRLWDGTDPLGATDADLARLNRRKAIDVEQLRWDAMALMYGGQHRS
jgi:hypothetical protein